MTSCQADVVASIEREAQSEEMDFGFSENPHKF